MRVVIAAVVVLGVIPAVAIAHTCCYTGEASYYCSVAKDSVYGTDDECSYDGDTIGAHLNQPNTAHSYAFQSVKDQLETKRYVCTTITKPSVGRVERNCGYDFRRNCWDTWKHSLTSDELDCHDEDGVTHYVYMDNESSSGTVLGGHALW